MSQALISGYDALWSVFNFSVTTRVVMVEMDRLPSRRFSIVFAYESINPHDTVTDYEGRGQAAATIATGKREAVHLLQRRLLRTSKMGNLSKVG